MKLKRHTDFIVESMSPMEIAQNFNALKMSITFDPVFKDVDGYEFRIEPASGQWSFEDDKGHEVWCEILFSEGRIIFVNAMYDGDEESVPFYEYNDFIKMSNLKPENFEELKSILMTAFKKFKDNLYPLKRFKM